MALYSCEISDAQGHVRRETREAAGPGALAAEFAREGGCLVSATAFGQSAEMETQGPAESAPTLTGRHWAMRRRDALCLEFTEMLSALISSGLELRDALEIASGIARPHSELRLLIENIRASIGSGCSFSGALEKERSCFSGFYLGMIGLGERVGSVEVVLKRLCEYLEERKALRNKIAGASFYPLMVLALALAGCAAIVFILIPQLKSIFAGFDVAVVERMEKSAGLMTAALIIVLIISALIAGAFCIGLVLKNKGGAGALKVDRIILKLPLIGSFTADLCSLDFCSGLETLCTGAVPLGEGIPAAAALVPNLAYRGALLKSSEELSRGASLAVSLRTKTEIPARLSDWVAIGERSGAVELVFGQLRLYYAGEVERFISRLMSWIEPILMLVVGIFMIFLVCVFVLPLFSLYGAAF